MTGKIDFSNTDASTVIQSAVDKIQSTGGKIFIKSGMYILNSGLNLIGKTYYGGPNSGFIIEGEGTRNTILYNQSISPAITLKARDSSISNIKIEGNKINSGDGILITTVGLASAIGGTIHNKLSNLWLEYNNNGITISDATYFNLVSNVSCWHNRNHGIYLKGETINSKFYTPNANSFIDVASSFNTVDGMYIIGSSNNVMGGECGANGRYGIYIDGSYCNIIGMYTENNTGGKGIFTGDDGYHNVVLTGNISEGVIFTKPNNMYIHSYSTLYSVTAYELHASYLYLDYEVRTKANGGTRYFKSWDGNAYQNSFALQGGYCDLLRGRHINMETVKTTLNGTTSGSLTWSMPFQGGSYKKFVGCLNNYQNNTSAAQTVAFPTAFTNIPVLSVDNSDGSSASTINLMLPINMTTSKTGWIIIEGY